MPSKNKQICKKKLKQGNYWLGIELEMEALYEGIIDSSPHVWFLLIVTEDVPAVHHVFFQC